MAQLGTPVDERFAGTSDEALEKMQLMAAQRALERIDERLAEAEKKILEHHSVQLTKWTREQQLALHRAAELDAGAIQARSSASDACIASIRDEIEKHAEQRAEARVMADESRSLREEQFHEELHELGAERTLEVEKSVRHCAEVFRSRGEELEEAAWEKMESNMHAIAVRHARAVHSDNLANSVAEVYNRGELQPHLAIERDGLARCQDEELTRLRDEIDGECQHIFERLERRLRAVAPNGINFSPNLDALRELATTEKKRLIELETEVREQYTPEIEAAMYQCDEDYRGYDSELQEVIFRTLDQRFKSACAMRQLKLALSRWRLDYQRAYHEQCEKYSEHSLLDLKDKYETDAQRQARLAAARRHWDRLRRAVLRIWRHGKVPVSEIHKFLARVTDSVARDGLAEPLLDIYRDELRQYGALPLLEHASSPEALNCWLDSLSMAG